MTEAEFISELESRGFGDVWTMSRSIDCGAKIGVGFCGQIDGQLYRSAVALPKGTPTEEAYQALLDWAAERVTTSFA